MFVDPGRLLCRHHPRAPREIADQSATFVLGTTRLHWFFVPGICEESAVVDWHIEDVGGIPLIVGDGHRGDGSPYFQVELPGENDLACGDAVGLASMTSTWRRHADAIGLRELQRRLHVMELFTCFIINLGAPDDPWTRSRNVAGWPDIEVGCRCGHRR